MRDRLIELLKRANEETNREIETGNINEIEKGWGFLADHLIAHGVTVQEWIPVTERLPEISEDVVVCHRNGWVTKDAWLGSNWWYQNDVNPITHWMPLPQPPKGE